MLIINVSPLPLGAKNQVPSKETSHESGLLYTLQSTQLETPKRGYKFF